MGSRSMGDMMKKLITFLILSITITALAACDDNSTPANDYVAEMYFYLPEEPPEAPDQDHISNLPTIQDFFQPKYIPTFARNVRIGGEPVPEFIRFYPFGAIYDAEDRASFVMFIENGFEIEHQENLLSVFPAGRPTNMGYMEITQVANITPAEMEYQILAEIDSDRYPRYSVHQGSAYTLIWLRSIQGQRDVDIHILDNAKGGVFVVRVHWGNWEHRVSLLNAAYTLEVFDPQQHDAYPADDSPEPMLALFYLEGTPNMVRLYPHVFSLEQETQGITDFLIFIEAQYHVDQYDNLLRITPAWELLESSPQTFMEIAQIPNITVEEKEQEVLSAINLGDYDYIDHRQPPYAASIVLYRDRDDMNSPVVVITIKDNAVGGVFVITSQYSLAMQGGGLGTRFYYYLSSLTPLQIHP